MKRKHIYDAFQLKTKHLVFWFIYKYFIKIDVKNGRTASNQYTDDELCHGFWTIQSTRDIGVVEALWITTTNVDWSYFIFLIRMGTRF